MRAVVDTRERTDCGWSVVRRGCYLPVLIVGLGVSILPEHHQWSLPAVIGVLLVLAGNLLVLARRRPSAPLSTSPLPAAGRSGN